MKEKSFHYQRIHTLWQAIFEFTGKDRVMASKQMVERVFGLPQAKKDLVKKVKTGMKIFLYDFDPHSL